jgi:hypothetical protein
MPKGEWQVGETRHMVLDIEGALRKRKMLRGLLVDDATGRMLTVDEAHAALCRMMRAGRKYLPMGCPTPMEDGDCPGHRSEAAQ